MAVDSKIETQGFFSNSFGLIVFAVFGVCFIPFVFYLINANEFSHDYRLLAIPVSVAFLLLGIGLLLGWVFSFSNRINVLIQTVFAYLGLLIFFNDLLVPTKAMSLDGTINLIPEPLSSTLTELLIALVLLVFMVFYKGSKATLIEVSKYAVGIFLLLIAMVAYTHLSHLSSQQAQREQQALEEGQSDKPNIYMIWLDGMQSDYFTKGVNELNAKNSFQGFTQFVNNMSNYIYSWHSYKSFFNSSFYSGADFDQWKKQDHLRQILQSEGYRLSSYARSTFLSETDDYSIVTNDIYEIIDGVSASNPYVSDFVSLSMVKMAPNFLANEALELGVDFGAEINAALFTVELDQQINPITSVNDGMYPYMSTLLFDKSIKDESSRKGHGEFVLLQAIIPHAPYVLDRDCEFVGVRTKENRPKRRDVPYYEQALCGIKLTIEFIAELKKQGKYENSMIVVFGDHGNGTVGLLRDKKPGKKGEPVNANYTPMTPVGLFARTKALLMIKPPNHEAFEFNLSSKESQLIDILPTMVDLIGLPVNEEISFEGVNLFAAAKANRKSLLYYFKMAMYYDMEDAEVYDVVYDAETEARTGVIKFIEKF